MHNVVVNKMPEQNSMKFDYEINAQGLFCPEPVMMLHSKINEIPSGDVVFISATDPSTKRDIARFCQFLGHELLLDYELDGVLSFYIKKS